MDGVHDMGGMHGFGPVAVPGAERTHDEAWEVRAQMVGIMAQAVSRPRLEGLPPAEYLGSSYYVRWLLAAERGAVDRGLVEPADLDRWREAFAADPELEVPPSSGGDIAEEARRYVAAPFTLDPATDTRYEVGDQVRVRRCRPVRHHRCPRYVRGVEGQVEAVIGVDLVPGEPRAADEREPVYTVRFQSVDLWGRSDEPPFELMIDLWERYLEPA